MQLNRTPKTVWQALACIALGYSASTAGAQEIAYTYDEAKRLVQVAYPQGSGILYIYDSADNLTRMETISLPPAPTDFSVYSQQANTAQLQWEAVSSVSGYAVYRRSDVDRVWTELTTVPANTRSFVDTTLIGGTNYVYQLFAIGPNGFRSAGSAPVSPIRLTDETIPTRAFIPRGFRDQVRVTIQSVEGAKYALESTEPMTPANWQRAIFSIAPAAQPGIEPVTGTGGELTLYVPHDFAIRNRFLRVVLVP